ncbi:MAG: hypothetical protein EOO20_26750 [Chryseobacterium sp.]|nr:MAG: hypothetical protein EOO20_26750 [Chryseobacterium sp.]
MVIFTLEEYVFYIDNHKKYKNFNTLGLYRSLIEQVALTLDEKLTIRDHAHSVFQKTFDFLQLKDPGTYLGVITLGQSLTKGEEQKIWDDIRKNQQKILANKRIRHRNFGVYSKHRCPYADCPFNGLMVRQGSDLVYGSIHFDGDKNKYAGKVQSDRRKSARKRKRQIIYQEIEAG